MGRGVGGRWTVNHGLPLFPTQQELFKTQSFCIFIAGMVKQRFISGTSAKKSNIKIILIIIFFILISLETKSQDTIQPSHPFITNNESPFKLQKFSQGFNLGYEAGVFKFSNQLFLGHYVTFCSEYENYALNMDNYIFYNSVANKLGFNTTFSFRFPNFVSIAFSSDFYIENELHYRPGIGLNYEFGGFLAVGGYYYYKPSNNLLESNAGIRLIFRPSYLVRLINNP